MLDRLTQAPLHPSLTDSNAAAALDITVSVPLIPTVLCRPYDWMWHVLAVCFLQGRSARAVLDCAEAALFGSKAACY